MVMEQCIHIPSRYRNEIQEPLIAQSEPARGFKFPDDPGPLWVFFVFLLVAVILYLMSNVGAYPAFAARIALPGGDDPRDKLEAAGTLLRAADIGIFQWGARVFSGLCIMSSAWSLKEQRFGMAGLCMLGAILFGTAPHWVKNIFEIGDNQGLFSHVEQTAPTPCTTTAS